MIALGGPTLKLADCAQAVEVLDVSMIALGGPTLKLYERISVRHASSVSMIALGGPTLKPQANNAASSLGKMSQ